MVAASSVGASAGSDTSGTGIVGGGVAGTSEHVGRLGLGRAVVATTAGREREDGSHDGGEGGAAHRRDATGVPSSAVVGPH